MGSPLPSLLLNNILIDKKDVARVGHELAGSEN
ncbi:hypothetical protein T4D_3465 [Trichinella pseudospiralis]|uniref:Uncharacterized protein n=1 Tax=Trichinella pseudospiralis TaxID=6337 RepID=A0A0V1C5Z0_TRIPS|nr:hypothetical protein T4D_3465 [Trichinella pseudospiralis]